jgi:uncharacterized membrane protein
MEADPGQVLRYAIPASMRATFPTGLQGALERKVQLQGELEILVEENKAGAKLHYNLKSGGQRLSMYFAKNPPTNLLSGSIIRVQGVQLQQTLALSSGTSTSSLNTVSPALPNTFGQQNTLVMLVNFQDNTTQPYTTGTAYNVVFGSSSAVTGFDMENSFQQTWLNGNVVGWYTLPLSSTTCDNNSIASYANQAASAAGVNLANYTHYVYAFPKTSACGWWGLGTVGGNPSRAWINGSFTLKVVGHEMGHNFGLYHSHAWNCGGTTLGSSCTSVEYGDALDIMGNPTSGHFNAFQKERLAWLNYGSQPPIQTVQSSGSYTIGPYENQDGTTKALKILQSTSPTTGYKTWYYVEFRQANGYDSFLSNNSNVLNGVVVHMGTDNSPNSSELLNMAPSSSSFYTSALDAGQTFIDPTAGLTLQTISTSPSGASVSVTFGTPTCSNFNPTVSISPSQSQTVQAGTTVSYTVSITDNDNAGCSSTAFNLSAAVPSGWSAGFANSSVTLSPGASAATTLQVTSPASAATGIYNVSVTSTNSSATSFSGTASATYVLNTTPCSHANPTVSLSPSQSQSVAPGTTVLYVLSLTNNDNSSCTSSSFNLSDTVPSGWNATLGVSSAALTVAPGGSASTSLNVTSPGSTAGGSYSITATASNASAPSFTGTGSATYVVSGSTSTCTRANPTVTMSPSLSPSVAPGTPVAYSVNVTDNDTAACATTNFNLAAALPSGWNGTWSSSTLALSPGTGGSATLTVTSPSTAATGSYSIGASATDASATSYVGSANATYSVATTPSLSVSISTDSSSYLPGQMVNITVTVSSAGTAVAGASVSVNVVNPNGSTSTLSSTTSSNGMASLKYKLKRQAPAGTYQAQANTAATGSSATTGASTTFLVQ